MAQKNRLEMTVESAQEQIVSIGRFNQVLTMEDALKTLMRQPAQKKLIPALSGSCPAFEFWVDRLQQGERLPRGKYFRSCEFIRR